MTNSIRVIALTMAGTLAGAASVRAQSPAPAESQILMSVSIGGQFSKTTFNQTTSFPLYNELATVSDSQQVGHGAVFISAAHTACVVTSRWRSASRCFTNPAMRR